IAVSFQLVRNQYEQTLAAWRFNVMAIQQRIRESRIAQRSAVVVVGGMPGAACAQSFRDCGIASDAIAHQIQGNSQMHEGETGLRLSAQIVQHTQGCQRSLSSLGKNISSV